MSDDSTMLEPIAVYGSPPTPNPPLAKQIGLPETTLFHKPDTEFGYVDYQAGPNSPEQRHYFDEREEGDNFTPPHPAHPDPAPPEIIPDERQAMAICLSPDVCRAPDKPTPFMVYGTADNDTNYSPNVFSNGLRVKHQQSKFSCCFGDEPGVGLGCCSNTVGDVVEPATSSSIVYVNGIPVQRHGDLCTLNNGNTTGEYCYVLTDDAHPAPAATDEHDKAWYEKAWNGVTDAYDWTSNKVSEANQAVWEFDRNHGKVVTRSIGVVGVVTSAVEGAAGAALAGVGGAASATGVGAAPGVPAMIGGGLLVANAWDNGQASLQTVWTGEFQKTNLQKAAGGIARAAGASPEVAENVENVTGLTQAVGGGVGAAAATMRTATKTAAVGAEASRGTAVAGEVAEAEAKSTSAVATTGKAGARSTRKLSLRLKYLGKTPGKLSRTGREVRERMRQEGLLRTNRRGADEFLDENNIWRPVDSPQTHMGHHPIDAVDYWNNTGRFLGAKSQEVRDWMLNSDNYRFEWGPTNSSRGGQTTSRYLPPAK